MSILLDTNTCVQYLNGRSDRVREHMAATEPDEILLCSVVRAELIYVALKSNRVEQNLERVGQFVSRFVSLSFDDAAGDAYGRIRWKLEAAGTPIGPNDLLIAATAVANRVPLATHNLDEFRRVDGLEVVDWEA